MAIVTQQLRLTDTSDVFRTARWRSEAGPLYDLDSGRLVVRATEDTADPLIDRAATIVDDNLAVVTITKADIEAADFEALLNPAVWEFVITRTLDGRTISAIGGSVVWSKGVAW